MYARLLHIPTACGLDLDEHDFCCESASTLMFSCVWKAQLWIMCDPGFTSGKREKKRVSMQGNKTMQSRRHVDRVDMAKAKSHWVMPY